MTLLLHSLASRDLDASVQFYRDHLGMRLVAQFGTSEERKALLRFAAPSLEPAGATAHPSTVATLELRQSLQADAPGPGRFSGRERQEGYWKIGITVANVEQARRHLVDREISVSEARKFSPIGVLCHLEDPDGHVIELLQHSVDPGAPSPGAERQTSPALGQPATFAHVTLRCAAIEETLAFYRDLLGLRVLSRLPLQAHGFTLHFLALSDEVAPGEEVDDAHREWLWRRPYTLLELQHFDRDDAASGTRQRHGPESNGGFLGITFNVPEETLERVRERHPDSGPSRGPLLVRDPDGAAVTLRTSAE